MSRKADKTMAKFLAKKAKDSRLNVRLPLDLLAWAKDYARRNNTAVTWLIEDYFRELQKKDTEVPQI